LYLQEADQADGSSSRRRISSIVVKAVKD
jgi:hypothetical protein